MSARADVDAREVALERKVLAANDDVAMRLRQRFVAARTVAINILSSPGSGKTTLLTALLRELGTGGLGAAALVGACATDNDARRLAASGAPVLQIVTEGMCHLEADMIDAHLDRLAVEQGAPLDDLDVLLLENVGNLVCPAGFDLGETERWVLLSVSEGEDKPLKYPAAFAGADVVVISKIDLAEPCRFDRAAAHDAIRRVAPRATVIETSSFTGEGLQDLLRRAAAATRQEGS